MIVHGRGKEYEVSWMSPMHDGFENSGDGIYVDY
jgi:hypothetical protein